MGAVLIAGGDRDPNLAVLVDRARQMGIEAIDLRIAAGSSPAFDWQLPQNRAFLAGAPLRAAGAFIRYDVFSSLDDPAPHVCTRANGWFAAIQAWAAADSVRVLNRDAHTLASYKPAVLALAVDAGLVVPPTFVTNSSRRVSDLPDPDEWIAKPVAGGDYCRALGEVARNVAAHSADAPMPAIVQRRLSSPELRLYVVGASSFAFRLDSRSLDYRERQDAELCEIAVPHREERGLRDLMGNLRMDFGAADFKRDPETGEWVFLELNTSPMFARFDEVCGGRVGEAILGILGGTAAPALHLCPPIDKGGMRHGHHR